MTLNKILTLIAIFFSFIVIGISAHARLIDTQLAFENCVDCNQVSPINTPQTALTTLPFGNSNKWLPLLQTGLSLLILLTSCLYMVHKQQQWLAGGLMFFAITQLSLSLGTTNPLIIMYHFMGNFISTLLLTKLYLGPKKQTSRFDKWAYLIFAIIFIQIFLGGWVSTSHAALVCTDFPTCHGNYLPTLSLKSAVHFLSPLSSDDINGLNQIAKTTIHMMHRYFSIIVTFATMTFLALAYYQNLAHRCIIFLTTLCLSLQILLGIMSIIYLLPPVTAILHTIFGLLLLLLWTWLSHTLSDNRLFAHDDYC